MYAFAEWNSYLSFLNSFIHMIQLLGDRQSGVTWYALSKEILRSCSQNASVKRGEFGSSWHVYSRLTEALPPLLIPAHKSPHEAEGQSELAASARGKNYRTTAQM